MAQQTSIYKSVDKGQNWQSIGTGLTNVQINSIAYYANSNEGLYLGTDIGVFYRDASMTEWIYFGNGMPASVKVTELEIYYSPEGPAGDLIRAGTYGRGLWSSPPYFGSLQAALQPETDSLTAGCNISFTDLTLGTPYTWLWSFEGGLPATSTEQHPQNITYPNEGVFSVTLTVENPLGSDTYVCEDCVVVLEAAPPAVAFEASQTVGCAGMVIPFTDLTTNCPESWDWTFNPATVVFVDGTNAQSANPVVQFLENTSYSVSLTATNSSGPSTLTLDDYILLGGLPVPYTENFELATFEAAGWEVQNPDNLRTWDINTLNDGTNTAWMNFFNYTNFDQRDFLVSPPLNFQGFENMYLSFEYAYAQRYMQTDSLIVSISPDCGTTWQRIYANGPDGNGIFETAAPNMQFFTPETNEDWCFAGDYGASCPTINLTQFAGLAGLKLRFESFNRFGNNLYLRNIVLTQITELADEQQDEGSWSVAPNPSEGSFVLSRTSAQHAAAFEVHDMQGRKVLMAGFDAGTFSKELDGFAPGMYLIISKERTIKPLKLIIK
jgi:PKD repeat protein